MKTAMIAVLATMLLAVGSTPAAAAPINVCGTLQALTRPNPPQQEGAGSATIDGRTYRLTSSLSTNNTNTIAPGVAVGGRVCLSGDLVDGTDLIQNFVLAPAGTAVGSLPSTSTASADSGLMVLMLVAGMALGSALVLVRRRS